MRPLIERAAVLSYLIANPPAVALWESGWKHAHRPSLARMLQSMSGTNIDPKTAQAVCDTHNHIVHADPVGTYHNLVDLSDGRVGYASSKMLDSPEMANRISMEAQCYLVVLGGRMAQVSKRARLRRRYRGRPQSKLALEVSSGPETWVTHGTAVIRLTRCTSVRK